jgi:GTP-binding protein
MFIDETEVELEAGNGGDGCVSFRREKYIPKGGPNGGDGGNGGHIVLVGDENTTDLSDFRFNPRRVAENGEPGRGADQYGRNGKDYRLLLPLGTEVWDLESDLKVAEILHHGEEIVLCRGGNGGWGNKRFKSSTNQTPRNYNPGLPGEKKRVRLVLKTIAEIGLVGFPNAGKSSLIRKLTNARPKAASYPFTTLHPNVGVMENPETYQTIRIADIPGLIEGASDNKGLGHRFLRHIERCRLLLFLVDMAGVDNREPWDDYRHLRKELERYDPALLEKPFVVVANKMDLEVAAEKIKAFEKKIRWKPLRISCDTEEGLEELRRLLWEQMQESGVEPPRQS